MVSSKVPIKVSKRSGFDKSHHNAVSQLVGKIVPVLVDEVIPNTKINLRYAFAGSMPPFASDAYAKIYYDIRAFFVPMRLLYGGFESWFSNYAEPRIINYEVSQGVFQDVVDTKVAQMPRFRFDCGNSAFDPSGILGRGTLADYLGFKMDSYVWEALADKSFFLSALPFLAYHKVVNDWYRQPNITREFFARGVSYTADMFNKNYGFAECPYSFYTDDTSRTAVIISNSQKECMMADGVTAFELRSCNWDYDYFTNALPSAQLGSPMTVASSSSFTIASLRAANSLQQFAELNQLAGSKLVDVVKARYNANLSVGVAQRAVYLGGSRLNFSTRSVDINANIGSASNNPFSVQAGASQGKVYASGSDIIIDGFEAAEPGYIFVMASVVPKVTYGSGCRRYLRHYIDAGSLVDMANPLLQNIGNQPIYQYELNSELGLVNESSLNIFGYTDRYAEFMTMEDEVHGILSMGESLESFVAQRYFDATDNPVIGTNFLNIPTTALDNVTATSSALSAFGMFGQFAFDYKVSQPLAEYSLPSLQNPAYEHGDTVMIHRGGFRF